MVHKPTIDGIDISIELDGGLKPVYFAGEQLRGNVHLECRQDFVAESEYYTALDWVNDRWMGTVDLFLHDSVILISTSNAICELNLDPFSWNVFITWRFRSLDIGYNVRAMNIYELFSRAPI